MTGARVLDRTASVLLEAISAKTAPAAIINTDTDFFFALASVVAHELYASTLPLLALHGSDFATLRTGDEVQITEEGTVTIERSSMNLPSHEYLDTRNIPYQRKSLPPGAENGAANGASVLGFAER